MGRIRTLPAWGPLGTAALVAVVGAACTQPAPSVLTVAAASSLSPVMDAASGIFRAQTGSEVQIVLGASVDLGEQIRNGAPIDLFFSADPAIVDELASEGMLVGPPTTFAYGGLSLALSQEARRLGPPEMAVLSDESIARIAIADPGHAPFGVAARDALSHAGLWGPLEAKIVLAGTALQALQFVETGNAQAGLVPTSLAIGSELVSAPVPRNLYDPPRYAVGRIRGSTQPTQQEAFVQILLSESGKQILVENGLIPAVSP